MLSNEKKKAFKTKLALLAVLAAIGAVAALIIGRLMTVATAYDSNPLVIFFSMDINEVFSRYMSDPLTIAWEKQDVWLTSLIVFLIPFAIGFVSFGKGFDANYDTGKEHGDSHLATEEEMASLVDNKFKFNNLHYTEHSGLPLKAHDKKTSKALDSRNYNMICFGISGRGKTFYLSKPIIMASTGCAVPFVDAGWQNIFEHFHLACSTSSTLRSLKPISEAFYKAKLARDDAKYRKVKRAAAKCGVGAGFDMIITDPKGDDLRDLGHLHRLAGQTITVLNLVDLEASMCYNPLAYIKTQEIDLKDPEDIKVNVSGSTWVKDRASNKTLVDNLAFSSPLTLDTSTKIAANASSMVFSAEVSSITKSYGDPENLPDGSSREQSADDLAYIRSEMAGERQVVGADGKTTTVKGCEKVAEVVSSTTYTRTSCEIVVEVTNHGRNRRSGEIEIVLDDALVVESIQPCFTSNFEPTHTFIDSVSIERVGETNTFKWCFAALPAKRNPSTPTNLPVVRCVIKASIKPMIIPDGVDLAKTVNTLVENLGSHGVDGVGEDPFWEDAKRLFFMGLIAYSFERYPDPKYHTIPVMCDLMDVALADGGDVTQPSALKAMMDIWEYARRPVKVEVDKDASMRSTLPAQEKFVATNNAPHERSRSLALHCYRAFAAAAPETVQSIVISCQTALIKLLSPQVRKIMSKDQMCLDKFGDPGSGRVLYLIINDNDDTYAFFSALLIQQVIELSMTKAYKKYGGKLPRHVRLELDECKNIGKIPSLEQATSTVRSRNMSIAMYFQSYSQVEHAYGEKAAATITNNCTTWMFLGAQRQEDLKMISEKIGEETVYSRTFTRSFNGIGVSGSNEQINATGRAVQSTSQINQSDTNQIFAFYYGMPAVKDDRYNTRKDPLYCYADACDQTIRKDPPQSKRKLTEPIPRFDTRFDYVKELMSERSEIRSG